jgi:hypothetical protein
MMMGRVRLGQLVPGRRPASTGVGHPRQADPRQQVDRPVDGGEVRRIWAGGLMDLGHGEWLPSSRQDVGHDPAGPGQPVAEPHDRLSENLV